MLGGLLKTGWRSDSVEKRRSAILKMKPADNANQAIFEKLAIGDPDQSIRRACLKQLRLAGPLFKAYTNQSDATTKALAKTQFCRLIGIAANTNKADIEALLLEYSDARLLVAQHSPDAALRKTLLNALTQTEQAQALGEMHYAETRLHIANGLNEVDALEIARRNLKGKDKTSEKVIRSKLKEYRAQQKIKSDVNENALMLCEKMEFIANHPEWRSEFKSKYEQFTQRWAALALSPEATTVNRFDIASQTAYVNVATQSQRESIEQNQADIADKLERYCAALAPLSLNELAAEHLSINTVLAEASSSWLADADRSTPNSMLVEKFLAAQQALTSVSDLIESTSVDDICLNAVASNLIALRWPTDYTTLTAKAEATKLLNDLKQQNKEQEKEEKIRLDALHKRINRLLGVSNKGDIKKAKRELSAISNAANHHSPKEQKILHDRLEIAAKAVSKMSDWQNFAIEPKLIALCEAMETLIDAKPHPDQSAKEIYKLQTTWKNLGHTEITDRYWPRFKAAADLAYAPCAVFFEQRRATQKDNLSKREPLIAQLQTLLDSTDDDTSPDYKKIEKDLRNIHNDWRKVKDVERKSGQKQWDRFNSIRNAIYQKLDVVYDASIDQKKQLIAQVISLADGSVNDDSLKKLTLFQSRWKQVGVTRRKQDQQAWIEFQAAGDALFEKVKRVRNEQRAFTDQQLNAYRDIIKQIHSLAKSATNLADADTKFDRLETSYRSLPSLPKELPEKLIERLESDFTRAGEAYSQAHDRIIQASKDSVINTLREKANLCGQLEAAIANKDTHNIDELEQQLETIIMADKSLEIRFKSRLDATKEKDKTAANQTRTLLCIDLEILLNVASPEQDKALRMQVQLERMKTKGIGHSSSARKTAIDELTLNWLCLPGAEPSLQATLEKRFSDLMKQV